MARPSPWLMRSKRRGKRMIRIAITAAAFDAVASTLKLGFVGYESEPNERGERLVWLETRVVDRLTAMREPRESYSDVILRMVELKPSDALSGRLRTPGGIAPASRAP
jgi:hypothetical protein